MESLQQFGIEPLYLVAQIFNFLVLLYLLKRFLYGPILGMLKKREEKIQEGLDAAVRGEELLLKAKKEEKELLSKATEEAELLLEETKERAMQVEQSMLSRAKEESEAMMRRLRTQMEDEKKRREKELEVKVISIAASILERALPKLLTKKDQIRILESSEKVLKEVL